MIPEVTDLTVLEIQTEPSYTYRFDMDNKVIHGTVDEKEAVIQMIRKTLATEKFVFAIYDGNYGTELPYLIGKPLEYVQSEVQRMVRESLLVDDRITDVSEFSMNVTGIDTMELSFLVSSVYGSIRIQTEVMIG